LWLTVAEFARQAIDFSIAYSLVTLSIEFAVFS
jgi:hypothetical protein